MNLITLLEIYRARREVRISEFPEEKRLGLAKFVESNSGWLTWAWSGFDWNKTKSSYEAPTDFSRKSLKKILKEIASKFVLGRDLSLCFVSRGDEFLISGSANNLISLVCDLQEIDDDIISDIWFFSKSKMQLIEISHEGYVNFALKTV